MAERLTEPGVFLQDFVEAAQLTDRRQQRRPIERLQEQIGGPGFHGRDGGGDRIARAHHQELRRRV